ncbi:MAG TPA: ATP-binding protein [Streptosporangiaceae bacterium]|nr:ATP-binding protein [Streptosporangiaceae bacterium]
MELALSVVLPRPVMDVEVRLEPTMLAPKLARQFVARELERLGYSELVEDARLVVSELVTNSITNVSGMPVWVDLRRAGRYVVLEVWDCSTVPPAAQDPDCLDEGGRGLQVVRELGVRWGYDIFCGGKVVWILLG